MKKIIEIICRLPARPEHFQCFLPACTCERGDFGQFIILADSGYRNTAYTATPYLQYATEDTAKNLYNESQIRTRNVVERSYGVLKRRFPVLSLGIRLKLDRVEAVIVACEVLHNIAIDSNDVLPSAEVLGFDDILAASTVAINQSIKVGD